MKNADDIYRDIGRRVRAERARRGWTQEGLAEKAEVHLSFIGQLERGIRKPSLITLKKIADAFGIKAGALFDEASPTAKSLSGPDFKLREYIRTHYSPKQCEVLYDCFLLCAKGFKKFPRK